ncbi:MAG: EamA family transporter [Desulfuromonadaceae bacterium]|jgi:drug/metabolite transporter (DMT)-like permease|nr:EamA family transporter [Desulfuromonadaceae bacterium]
METLALLLILCSALMHALWNLLVKQSSDKTVFIWWMFVNAWALMTLALWLRAGTLLITSELVWLSAVAAVCFVVYHWLGGYAYRSGDLSVTYPLVQTSMLYVPLWGVLFLGEHLSIAGLAGIGLIAVGAYGIQLRRLSWRDALYPLTCLRDRAVRAALLAGFIYSIGAVLDKIGVNAYPAFDFTYVLVFFMLVFMSLNLLRPCYRGRVMAEARHHPRLVLISGPVIMASFLSFRYGLSLAPVSYAVPVRQVSLLIGVGIGLLFLGETCGRIRLGFAALILLGVFGIWHG